MRIFTKFKKTLGWPLFALCFTTISLQSCVKNEAPVYVETAALSVINASPSLATYNFYLNQQKMNAAALPYGGVIPYFTVAAGQHATKFTTAASIDAIIAKEIAPGAGKVYSLYLTGTDTQMDYLVVTEEMEVNPEKSFLKFINLSPDAQALSLGTDSLGKLADHKGYREISEFKEIAAKTHNFQIIDQETGSVLATLPQQNLSKGKHYTIIARGMRKPSDVQQPFSAQLIVNR